MQIWMQHPMSTYSLYYDCFLYFGVDFDNVCSVGELTRFPAFALTPYGHCVLRFGLWSLAGEGLETMWSTWPTIADQHRRLYSEPAWRPFLVRYSVWTTTHSEGSRGAWLTAVLGMCSHPDTKTQTSCELSPLHKNAAATNGPWKPHMWDFDNFIFGP